MQTVHASNPSTNRYLFDFTLCTAEDGWAQLDTTQDAPWHGNWANPFNRQVMIFQEGDETLHQAATDAEFVQAVRNVKTSQEACGHAFKGIDTMCSKRLRARFEALGLRDLLYPAAGKQAIPRPTRTRQP